MKSKDINMKIQTTSLFLLSILTANLGQAQGFPGLPTSAPLVWPNHPADNAWIWFSENTITNWKPEVVATYSNGVVMDLAKFAIYSPEVYNIERTCGSYTEEDGLFLYQSNTYQRILLKNIRKLTCDACSNTVQNIVVSTSTVQNVSSPSTYPPRPRLPRARPVASPNSPDSLINCTVECDADVKACGTLQINKEFAWNSSGQLFLFGDTKIDGVDGEVSLPLNQLKQISKESVRPEIFNLKDYKDQNYRVSNLRLLKREENEDPRKFHGPPLQIPVVATQKKNNITMKLKPMDIDTITINPDKKVEIKTTGGQTLYDCQLTAESVFGVTKDGCFISEPAWTFRSIKYIH